MHEKKGQELPTTLTHKKTGFSRSGVVPDLHNVPGPMQGAIFEVRYLFFSLKSSVCAILSGPAH
jgi:hypothetical protein